VQLSEAVLVAASTEASPAREALPTYLPTLLAQLPEL
jgi:hypothetical protein